MFFALNQYYLSTATYALPPFLGPYRRFIVERPSPNTVLTTQDLDNCGYHEVLASLDDKTYLTMQMALWRAAETKLLEGKKSEGAILWLFADICEMSLHADSFNEPFVACMNLCGKRSMIPDDLSEEQLKFIDAIYTNIADNYLRARLADILYLKNRKNWQAALAAIDAYMTIKIPSQGVNWVDVLPLWERALFLAKMLRKKAEKQLMQFKGTLTSILFNSRDMGDRRYLSLKIADILYQYKPIQVSPLDVAQFMEESGNQLRQNNDFWTASDYYEAACQWYQKAGATDEANSIIALKANAIETYAISLKKGNLHNISSRHFLTEAIQEYRKLPSAFRYTHGYTNKLNELQVELDKANSESMDSMSSIALPPVDISEQQKQAENVVKGKALNEAFQSFGALIRQVDFGELRQEAQQASAKSLMSQIAQRVAVSSEGRVIAMDSSDNNIDSMIVDLYFININLKVQSYILPALGVLQLEHRVTEQDFYKLTRNNLLVPSDRTLLAAKVLYYGYDGNWVPMLYMLAPLMEHIVRFHLKNCGVPTTHLDEQNIENEKGLSSLIGESECKNIFGESLTEEIRLLFCDSMGSNLRNNVAHGLLNDANSANVAAIYAWHLLLKLVLLNFIEPK